MKKTKREAVSLMATQRIEDGKGSWGTKDFGSLGRFRSSYEYAFAVYLNELDIKFEFEKHGQPIKTTSGETLHYIPDFFLPEYDVYIEIVTNMNRRMAGKMYCFTTQYQSKKLLVFDKKSLRNMFDSKFTIYDLIGFPKKTKK